MATNVYFNLIDSTSNPLTGSRVSLRPWSSPYFTGTFPNQTGTWGGPIVQYSSATGTASFNNVVPGVYRVSYTGPNANNPPYYINYQETTVYIDIEETNGGTQNGFDYVLNALPSGSCFGNVPSSSYSISSSYALTSSVAISASYAPGNPSISASYALTASYALNGGSGGGSQISCSWASQSLSSSFSTTASYVASASYYPAFPSTVPTASYVATASYANVAGIANAISFVPNASTNATQSLFATQSVTASFVTNTGDTTVQGGTNLYLRTTNFGSSIFLEATGSIVENAFGGNYTLTAGQVNITSTAGVNITGQTFVNGNISASVITASLFNGTASYAKLAASASYTPPSVSASYSITSSNSGNANTSSFLKLFNPQTSLWYRIYVTGSTGLEYLTIDAGSAS